MIARALLLATLLCALAVQALGQSAPPSVTASAQPDADEQAQRCTQDGRVCIASDTYAADVCRAIEIAATTSALDPDFFARLLWRESLFDAAAISPAGAQGIAQFMPGTARLRRLADPFNPAESILASATYLKELQQRFGNLGMAAVAYNAGEARATRYLAGTSGLPGETRAYVLAITGHRAGAWRAGALGEAETPTPDMVLDPDRPFWAACMARAEGRGRLIAVAAESSLAPWGVFFAGQASREAAERRAGFLTDGPNALLVGERIDYTHERFPGMRSARHFAQVGRTSRGEAEALCAKLRSLGTGCMVRRN